MSNFNKVSKPSTAGTRQAEVLLQIRQRGSATIGELARHFRVSEMTIRRVLHRLNDLNLVIRTPGGALALPTGSMERSFLERSRKMSDAKNALGRTAANLVQDGETVVLDSGTTTQWIARHLAGRSNLMVITTSLAALEELSGSTGVQVRLTGGNYRRISHDLHGSAVDEALNGIHGDWVFFGAAALSFQKGAMNFDPETPRAMLNAGRQKVLVIDSSKIGLEAVYRFCPIAECDLVIVDQGIQQQDLHELKRLTKVLVAEW